METQMDTDPAAHTSGRVGSTDARCCASTTSSGTDPDCSMLHLCSSVAICGFAAAVRLSFLGGARDDLLALRGCQQNRAPPNSKPCGQPIACFTRHSAKSLMLPTARARHAAAMRALRAVRLRAPGQDLFCRPVPAFAGGTIAPNAPRARPHVCAVGFGALRSRLLRGRPRSHRSCSTL